MRGMSLPALISSPTDAAVCWAASILPGLGVVGMLGLSQPRQCRRRRCKLLSGPDSVGETCESVRSIVNSFKSLLFLAGEAPLRVKSSQQMKQNKEEFNA